MQRKDILIEADELLTRIGDPNLRIFDTAILFFRKEDEKTAYERYLEGHIPGAAFFDHDQFSDASQPYMYMAPAPEVLAERLGAAGISAEHEVVVYTDDLLPCATRAWWLLRYAGHDNVRILNGGLAAWQAAGGEIASGGHVYPATSFSAQPRPDMFADRDEVLAAIQNGAVCTVNTLDPASYAQAHIEGSSLLSCFDLMEEMRAFRPNAELAARLKPEMAYEKVITYCGGGIAATVNGIAHLIAGNPNVAVYDGSMDEWQKEKLPLEIGPSAEEAISQSDR